MASLKPKTGEGTTVESFNYVPSAVHVDHANNFSRANRYAVPAELQPHIEGTTFCFTLAEVERRLSEFDRDGEQISAGTIYMTKTRDAFLVDGYLRHAAWLLAEVRYHTDGHVWTRTNSLGAPLPEQHKLAVLSAILAKCKKGVLNVFRSQKIAPPLKDDWAGLRHRNWVENSTRKKLSPIDRAYYGTRIIAAAQRADPELSAKQAKKAAADEMEIAERSLDRLLACLHYDDATQDKLHSGELSLSQAEKLGRNRGTGSHKGPRAGTPRANIRRAFELIDTRPPPTKMLDGYQQLKLQRKVAGIAEAVDVEPDPEVDKWAEWLNAGKDTSPKPVKPPTDTKTKAKTRKKKPATNKPSDA